MQPKNNNAPSSPATPWTRVRLIVTVLVPTLLVGLVAPGLMGQAHAQDSDGQRPGVIQRGGDDEDEDARDDQPQDEPDEDERPQPQDQGDEPDGDPEEEGQVITPENFDPNEEYNLPPNFDPDARPQRRPQNVKVTIDFRQAELEEVVKFFAGVMNKNFIISDSLQANKTITIISPEEVTLAQAYRAFVAALEMNRLTIVPFGNFLKIVEADKAISEPMNTYGEGERLPGEPRMVTAIVPVQNTPAEEMQDVISKFASQHASIIPYGSSLIITENAANLQRIRNLVKRLDEDEILEQVYVYEVQYAEAADIQEKLTELFDAEEGEGGNQPQANRRRRPAPRNQQKDQAGEGEGGDLNVRISQIMADERTNKLIIVANPRDFDKIRQMIELLDVPTAVGGQVHVKFLEYADAEELSSTLSNLTSGQNQQREQAQRAAMFDLERRQSVWQALARLFVDGELGEGTLREVAQALDASAYDEQELRHIYEREVAPVCYGNLYTMQGGWQEANPQWLSQAILEHRARQESVPNWWPFGSVPGRMGVEMTRSEWSQVLRLVRRLRRDPQQLVEMLSGCRDVATMVRALDDLALLAEGARDAEPAVVHALSHRDFRVRSAALKAAARMLGADALDDVLAGLSDDSPTVRSAAIEALHRVVDTIVAPLPEGADGSLVPTRSDRLIERISERALDEICGFLRDGKSSDRLHAARVIEALAAFARPAATWLFASFSDRNQAVRCAVADAVVAVDPDPEQTLLHLKKSLFDGSSRVRQAAAMSLARFLASGDRRYHPAIRALYHALDDASADVRQDAAAAIGWMGPTASEATERLAELAREPNSSTRAAALFALGRMEDSAIEELPSMAAALQDDHPEVRRAALRAFQNLGPLVRSLEPQFEQMLGDPDWLTQFEAKRTLQAVRGEPAAQAWSGMRGPPSSSPRPSLYG
ncbi:MAG: DUF7079 family protein [Persicimonas sp.]